MKRTPLLVVLGLLAIAIVAPIAGGELGFGSAPAASPSGIAAAPSGSLASEPTAAPSEVVAPPSAEPSAPPATASPGVVTAEIAVVPVTQFRAPFASTSRKEVAAVLAGTSTRYEALELVASEADAILAALGVERPTDATRLVEAPDAATLTTDMAANRKRLAFLRADAVTPAVRALAWGSDALFGVDRVKTAAAWPLTASLPAPADGAAFDPAATWTLFAGGDVMLDRGVYQTLVVNGKGADFPFDGGTAEITSRYCCSSFGWELPRISRTGDAGVVRDLVSGADIAIANFENPAPNNPKWHTKGTVFSADPKLIDGLANAGIDYVSIANNHIRDAGGAGIMQTIRNLEKRGLVTSGAGEDLADARTPAILEANGVKVAILGYDAIAKGYFATEDRIGSAPLKASYVKADVKAARAAGADIVIVFPHWGTEYKSKPFAGQQKLARMLIDNGADMVIGNHAHWAAAMEIYEGKPIWYALGNFIFDQTWSEPTMEGITLELTFHGTTLAQVRMRPHIILDKAQPNFLDPAGDGKVVLGQVFSASKGLLPW